MKFYGYRENADGSLLTLREVGIKARPEEVRRLAEFLSQVATTMEETGGAFGHEHFRDFCLLREVRLADEEPDLIVAR
jgi:hypothetical protein